MRRFWALALSAAFALPAHAKSDEQLKAARKFVEAVRGKQDYSGIAFVTPLGAEAKGELARFAKCSVATVNHGLRQDPHHLNSFNLSPDEVEVVGKCRGVPDNTPAGITLHFEGNRISSIETSNFDLIQPSQ
jgi:hypothetical protein